MQPLPCVCFFRMQATKQVLEGAEDSKRLDIFEDVGAYLEASLTPDF